MDTGEERFEGINTTEKKKGIRFFKLCPYCSRNWTTLIDFLKDFQIVYLGMMNYQGKILFCFTHKECGTTIGLSVEDIDQGLRELVKLRKQ